MGLGKTKKYSGAVYNPFTTNERLLPVTIAATAASTVVQKNMKNFADNLAEAIVASGYTKTRVYDRRSKTSKNVFGAATVEYSAGSINMSAIRSYIEVSHPNPDIEYAIKQSLNYYHYAYSKLSDTYGGIHPDNYIMHDGITKYIGNIQVYVDATYLDSPPAEDDDDDVTSGYEPLFFEFIDTPYYERVSAHDYKLDYLRYTETNIDKVEIELYWSEEVDGETKTLSEKVEFTMTEEIEDDYFMVKYTSAELVYYTYAKNIVNGYSVVRLTEKADSRFMESVYLLSDQKELWEDSRYSKYIHRSARNLGFNVDTIIESLKESEEYSKFQDTAIMFAYPLNTKLQIGKEYLYAFFAWANENIPSIASTATSIEFRNAVNKMTLTFNVKMYEEPWVYKSAEDKVVTKPTYITYTRVLVGYSYHKPISATRRRVYEVTDIQMAYSIPIKDTVVGLKSMSDPDMALLIPVSMAVVDSKQFNYTQKEQIIAGSMGLLVTWSYSIRISGWKRALGPVLTAIAVVAFVVGLFYPPALVVGKLTGAAAVAVMIAVQVVIAIALKQIMKYVVRLAVKLFGTEVATILAAIATIIAVAFGVRNPQGMSLLANTMVQAGGLWAPTTLEYLQSEISKIAEETERFAEYSKQELEELQEKLDSLKGKGIISPYSVWDSNSKLQHPTESVTSFIDRLIHTGNIATLALSYPEHYVELSLNERKI